MVSDIDDTILHTGAQRVVAMIRQTLVGSELTRTPFIGAPELYRALARRRPPTTTRSSTSPPAPGTCTASCERSWSIAGFPWARCSCATCWAPTPIAPTSHKADRIDEILELHPELPFVLIGDSGQHDPEIYAEAVRRHPGRILAVYIREVRLDPGDRRVELITDAWDHDVPFVLAADSAEVAGARRGPRAHHPGSRWSRRPDRPAALTGWRAVTFIFTPTSSSRRLL